MNHQPPQEGGTGGGGRTRRSRHRRARPCEEGARSRPRRCAEAPSQLRAGRRRGAASRSRSYGRAKAERGPPPARKDPRPAGAGAARAPARTRAAGPRGRAPPRSANKARSRAPVGAPAAAPEGWARLASLPGCAHPLPGPPRGRRPLQRRSDPSRPTGVRKDRHPPPCPHAFIVSSSRYDPHGRGISTRGSAKSTSPRTSRICQSLIFQNTITAVLVLYGPVTNSPVIDPTVLPPPPSEATRLKRANSPNSALSHPPERS